MTNRRMLLLGLLAASLVLGLLGLGGDFRAQKSQESYKDKFNISDVSAGVAVATSADGKYVYVAGPQGVIVSNDFGKTGTWVQTVRLK